MTAVAPKDEYGGTIRYNAKDLQITKTIKLHQCADPVAKVEEIRQYFHKTMDIFENVFRSLSCDDAFTARPVHKLRHPLIFYFGHTATFYLNKLVLAGLTTRINAKFEEQFAIGVDEMSWDDLNEAHYDWPKIDELWEYRQQVRDRIDEMLQSNRFKLSLPLTHDTSTAGDDNTFFWSVVMGIEHERIHLDTASVHLRELPLSQVQKCGSFWNPCDVSGEPPVENPMEEFEGAVVSVGRDPTSKVFGWDTDYATAGNTVDVAPFKASKYLVSNKHFYAFVQDGGYQNQKWWDEEGWNWVTWKKPTHPWFWVPDGAGSFRLRVQVEEIALPWDWPCETNNLEAKAYANWLTAKQGGGDSNGKKFRLPTEAEWLHMRDVCLGENSDQADWEKAPGNINFEQGFASSCPVTMFQQGKLCDVVGNVWQHTETPVHPYPGYQVHPLYDDFSMPTFDGRHYCMKGGAWISTGNEATRDARFAFRRHFFQFIGIRLVQSDAEIDERKYLTNVLGMDPEVDAQAHFGYGKPLDQQTHFAVRMANIVAEVVEQHKGGQVPLKPSKCLELYCGGGRTSFELTKTFEEVIGSDFSARRLQTAYAIRERGFGTYSVVNELGKREAAAIDGNEYNWNSTRENATFYQADPSNMHAHMSGFDFIVASNVLERCYKPVGVPAHLLTRLNVGGVILFAVHGQWDEDVVQDEHHFNTVELAQGVAQTNANVIRHLVQASTVAVEEVTLSTNSLTTVFPTTTRTGKFVDFELLAFRKVVA